MALQPFLVANEAGMCTFSATGATELAIYPYTNINYLIESRFTVLLLTGSTALLTCNLPSNISASAIVIPFIQSQLAAFRLRAYSGLNATGTLVMDSGDGTGLRILGFKKGVLGYQTLIAQRTVAASIRSYTLEATGSAGAQYQMGGHVIGTKLQFDRCGQEPTLRQLAGGQMVYTRSGIAIPAEPKRRGRVIDLPMQSITENDRIRLYDFEAKHGNKQFYACVYPEGSVWQQQQYSMLARFNDALSYQRRSRTLNHSTNLSLVEC